MAKAVAAAILALLLVVLVTIGGYQLGWWLKKENTDRQVAIDNRNLGTQTAWRDEAYDLINKAELLPEGAPQSARLKDQACELIGRLTGSYQDDALVIFHSEECV